MIHKIKYFHFLILGFIFFSACSEMNLPDEYDIKFPISTIESFSPKTAAIDEIVTIKGQNLDVVNSLKMGNIACEIISKEATEIQFKVSRSAERNKITISNEYRRNTESENYLAVTYPDISGVVWPVEIQRGKAFTIKGVNMDMSVSAKAGDLNLSRAGAASSESITYTTDGLTLPATVIITLKSKTNQTIFSTAIPVVAPKETYVPEPTIVLFDFDKTLPTIVAGDASGAGATFTSGNNLPGIAPFFGNYYSVKAPIANGWNGIYQILSTTNNGKGFDLTNYNDPHITFLVNTNGKQGYVHPRITNGDGTKDKHLTGQGGDYTDDYKIKTNGWEWRSYSLTKLGFTNIKSAISQIELLVRGGNAGNGTTEPFEINLDQVMITDGNFQPKPLFDGETKPTMTYGSISQDGGTGVAAAAQGNSYLTSKAAGVSSWTGLAGIIKTAINGNVYAANQVFYLNFLVNTGTSAQGYFQIIFKQDGSEYGKHFSGGNPYGDDYKFANTGGKWEWRSYRVNAADLALWSGAGTGLNFSNPFDFVLEFKTGNVVGAYETNIDYVFLSATPIDNKK